MKNFHIIYQSLILMLISNLSQAMDLSAVWELEGFSGAESAVFSQDGDTIYVSNVNGSPVEADGNGFISLISASGEMIQSEWLKGLNAPKGLALSDDNQLYVADIKSLVQIDVATAKVVNTFTDETAQFLNDVTIDSQGRVYVSDMMTNKIYVLDDGKFDVWLESLELESPNGLHAQGNYLILGSWGKMTDGFATEVPGHMKSIHLRTKEIKSLGNNEPIGNLDGVEPIDEDFLVTDWMAGKLFLFERDGGHRLLLQKEQGMADLGFHPEKKLIILPMMNSGKVNAYTY